jgi:4-amino-4-deoxy-L-arabinose transferase-like glycosyltransferase
MVELVLSKLECLEALSVTDRDTSTKKEGHSLLAAIICVGLLARLGVLIFYLFTHEGRGEEWEYEVIARNLLEGKGYVFYSHGTPLRSFGFPLFPFVSYLLHLVGGNDNFVPYFAFQLALSAGIIWLTFSLADRWFDRKVALLAGLLVAGEPGLIIYGSYKIHEMTLATFLLVASLRLFAFLRERDSWRIAVALGIVTGFGILTRPTLIAVFFALAVSSVVEKTKRQRLWVRTSIVLIVATLTVLPWLIRNYNVHGHFVFISSGGPEVFWRGNNQASTGSNLTLDGKSFLEVAPQEFREKVFTSNEMGRYDIFKKEALRYIASEPLEFVWRTVKKFGYFWWFTPTYGMTYKVPTVFRLFYKLISIILLGLAILGWAAALRKEALGEQKTAIYLLVLVVVIASFHAVSYVEGRHKLMVMPVILMFSAYGLGSLKAWFTRRPYGHFLRTAL